MKIWYLISSEAREALSKLYRKLAGFPFTPPEDDTPLVSFDFRMESTEEIAKLMQKPSKWRRPHR